MENVLSAAEQILRTSGAPALRLSVLLGEVLAATGERTLDALRLRALLEARPDRFRVLDPWRGPWRFVGQRGAAPLEEPWVVAVKDHSDGSGVGSTTVIRRIRESVRWLGLSLDERSPRRVARWHGLLLEGMAAERSLRKAA